MRRIPIGSLILTDNLSLEADELVPLKPSETKIIRRNKIKDKDSVKL